MNVRRAVLFLGPCALLGATTGCGTDGPSAVASGASTITPEISSELAAGGDGKVGPTTEDETTGGDGAAASGTEDGLAVPGAVPPNGASALVTTPPVYVPRAEGGDGVAPDAGTLPLPREPMPDTVAVVGDSIALSAEQQVTEVLEAHGLDVIAYDAIESRRMVNGSSSVPSGRNAVRDVLGAEVEPDLWIVALGTNDVGSQTGREAWEIAIHELMVEIPGDADLFWIDSWVEYLDEESAEFNATLRDGLRWRDDVWVLNWTGRAAPDGVLLTDGVHLSEFGRYEYARLIDDGLRAVYGD